MTLSSKRQLDRPVVQLVLTAGLVILALVARQTALHFGVELPAFITFYPVIMLVALLFGLWAGLLGTGLTLVLAAVWIFPPIGELKVENPADMVALALFFCMGVFMSVVAERHRGNRLRIAALEREKALLETREQVQRIADSRRLALEAANLGAWDYHLNTGEVVWDERCRNDFGFRAGDGLDYTAAIANIHQEDRAATDEAVKQAIAGLNGGAYTREFRVVWPDGSVHWISSHGKVYFDAEGAHRRATRFIGINTDITERRLGEEQRKSSEQRYRLLAETMLQGVVHQDADGKIIAMNPAAENILGWTIEEYLGTTSVQVDSLTIREDGSTFRGDEHPAMVALRTGNQVREVAMGVWNARTGSRRWINVTAVPLFRPAETVPYQVYTVFEDITERKRTEDDLRAAKRDWERTFNSVPDLIAILDNQHRIVRANRTMAQRLGVTPEACVGLECFGCVHATAAPIAMCPHTLTLQDGLEHVAELHEDRLGGDFLVTTTPLLNERGEMDGTVHVARDITASKRAEQALKDSEKRYRNLFNAMNEGFCIIEVLFDGSGKAEDYRFLEVNEAFERQTGLHDAVGKRIRELAPANEEFWFEIYGRIALTGEPAHFMDEAGALNRWYDVHAYRVGEPAQRRVAIVFNDFSDYKRAEDALRELAELLDLAHDTIMVFDLDGTIRFWNHGAEEMYGYGKEEATGRKSHELLSTVFPEPLNEIKARIVREGRWEGELAQVAKDGKGMIVDSRWVLQRDKDGGARGIMEINTDITKRVQAEVAQREAHLKLQSVLDSITDGLLMLESDWRFTYCSEHGARILGLRPEDLVGGRVWDLFPLAESSGFGKAYHHAVESREPVHFEEFYPEPLNMWLECHCYPTEEGLSVYFRDISERKRTEEALLRSEKLASVGRMAATIAHEINNPLAAITNILYLARMKVGEPASVLEFLDVAEDELKRITHITRQTLGFYRESSSPMIVSVNEVMDSALDLMKSKIGTKRAVIAKEWEGDAKASAIAGELRQVFSNLLGNSLDAIEEGGAIRLRICSVADKKEGRRTVRVTVADNGKGISDSSKLHIFEPFFTTKGTVGTGLGLWVTKQIVDKHHGKVRMRSSTDGAWRGTVFIVTLPVEPPQVAKAQS